ncbi:MAG: hypothetical protein LUE12_07970 [Ruminococcus sp.]|nr:hypothetical protein [Ruminococcus sp.]
MLNEKNNDNEFDIPLAVSMALSQNPYLLDIFTSLSSQQRQSFVGEIKAPHSAQQDGSEVQRGGRIDNRFI